MESTSHNRAPIHERVRRQHASEVSQDYVEAIHEIESAGVAIKVTSLQHIFGVSHVTVIRQLKRLQEQGLITEARSKKICLTKEGKEMAIKAAAKHALLKNFFMELGVTEAQADADAEGAEHHLSEETCHSIQTFLDTRK